MSVAYVLDRATRASLGVIDQSYARLHFTRRLWAMDTFEVVINRNRLYASELQNGRLLYLPDAGDLVFMVEQIHARREGSANNDLLTISGRSLEGIALAERHCIPPAGQSHDTVTAVAAETAIKHYVNRNAGPLAPATLQVPGLTIAADQARGLVLSASARYQIVLDQLRELGLLAGMGWKITYDRTADTFPFDVVVGVDRSASVFFDFDFETLEATEELDSILESKTVAIVAGQGEGADREIVTRWLGGVEPTGFDRREVFVDARDVALGQTAILQQRGDAVLAASSAERRIEATAHQYGSFRYREHWDLGDIVLARDEDRGISHAARVVEVDITIAESAEAPEVKLILDRPFPSLQDRVRGVSVQGAAVDRPVTLPPDPHAASHAIGGADTIAELLGRGVAFPAQPGYGADRPFYRSDRDLWYAYDGARWLCTCPHVSFVSRPGTFTSGENLIGRIPHPGKSAALNVFITHIHWSMYFLGATNDATNRWLCRFYSLDGTTVTLENGQETDSEGASSGQKTVTRLHNVGYGDGTYEAFDLRIAEQGAPSDVADISGSIEWRYMG